jgi:macrolide transport system ATP-binding/permease protein
VKTFWRELRSGLRPLFEHRAASAAALIIIVLGIGATSAVLSVEDALLLRGIPYRDPSRLVVLSGTFTDKGQVAPWSISQMDFADWRRQSKAFADMSVFDPDGDLTLNLDGVPQPERLAGELVSDSYFPLLGIKAERGRFFTRQEDSKPFKDYVVVLGHDLWHRRFGSDPGVVGRSVQLNGQLYRVLGIAPAGFRGLPDSTDLWIPSQLPPIPEYLNVRLVRWVTVLARLRPGVTIGQAQQEMNHITAALERQYPDSNKGMGVSVRTLADFWYGDMRHGLLLLALGALAVLVVACFDAAMLLLAGAGASHATAGMTPGEARARLRRRLLAESLVLSLAGAGLGLLLSQAATRALLGDGGLALKSWIHVSAARPEVIAAVVGLAVLCGLGCALLAASTGKRLRSVAVVAQVAAAVVLLAGAGLKARDYQKLIHQDLGFRPDHVLTYRIDIRGPKYDDVQPVRAVVRKYVEQLPAVPGVAQLALADPTLPTDGWAGTYISIEGHPSDAPQGTYASMVHSVTSEYFSILGIPLLAGRAFGAREWMPTGVVVSKATADKYWPGQSPLGKRLKNGRANAQDPWLTVLGVAADVKHEGIGAAPRPASDVYFPLTQFPLRLPLTINFLVRPKPEVAIASLMPALRRQMQAISADLPLFDVATLQERLDRQIRKARLPVVLIGLFAALALVLAAGGIFGLRQDAAASDRRESARRVVPVDPAGSAATGSTSETA